MGLKSKGLIKIKRFVKGLIFYWVYQTANGLRKSNGLTGWGITTLCTYEGARSSDSVGEVFLGEDLEGLKLIERSGSCRGQRGAEAKNLVVVKAGASGRQVKLSALGWRDFGYGS